MKSEISVTACFAAASLFICSGHLSNIDVTSQNITSQNVTSQLDRLLLDSDRINGIICIPDCGRYFQEGNRQFEDEVRRLQESPADTTDLLEIDPDLQNIREQWLEDLEARELEEIS